MEQESIGDVELKVYLVDDGSTDGTASAVKDQFPDTVILKGNGQLFWCGGTRLAFNEALKGHFQFYLWLNDDSVLYPYALRTILDTFYLLKRNLGQDVIVGGSMQDSKSGMLTYGGSKKSSLIWPLAFLPIKPSDKPQICHLVNGNCILISAPIAKSVGNIRECFTQGAGDYDYVLRAKKRGIPSFIAPGYIGTCPKNILQTFEYDNQTKKKLSKNDAVSILQSQVSSNRIKDWMLLLRLHGGILWPLYWLRAIVRLKFPSLWLLLRSIKSKYRDYTNEV